MLVHVAFTPDERTPAPIGIVVDVLRATSTMTQALASGYTRVLCCAEIDEARELAKSEGPAKLAGERRLESIPGFDFGNSPREVAAEPEVETLILSTTNGTRLLVAAAERFDHVYVGSLLNLDAVAAAARAHGEDVAVLCAGVLGELALDDAYCAGRIAEALGGDRTDSATAAIRLAGTFASARDGLAASRSAWNLRNHGLEADIDWCARENALDIAPRYVGTVGPAASVARRRRRRLPAAWGSRPRSGFAAWRASRTPAAVRLEGIRPKARLPASCLSCCLLSTLDRVMPRDSLPGMKAVLLVALAAAVLAGRRRAERRRSRGSGSASRSISSRRRTPATCASSCSTSTAPATLRPSCRGSTPGRRRSRTSLYARCHMLMHVVGRQWAKSTT